MGEARKDALRVRFDGTLTLECHGTKVASDAAPACNLGNFLRRLSPRISLAQAEGGGRMMRAPLSDGVAGQAHPGNPNSEIPLLGTHTKQGTQS